MGRSRKQNEGQRRKRRRADQGFEPAESSMPGGVVATFVTAAVAFDAGCVIWVIWQFHAYRHARISLAAIFLAMALTITAGITVRLSWMDRLK